MTHRITSLMTAAIFASVAVLSLTVMATAIGQTL